MLTMNKKKVKMKIKESEKEDEEVIDKETKKGARSDKDTEEDYDGVNNLMI